MRKKPEILVVIPHYNHGATLRAVVEQVLAVHPHVLVVDDGSSQDPTGLIEGLDCRIVRHSTNQGKGAAIITGAREARQRGMSHILTLDADLQHYPAELPKFIKALQDDPRAIVIGKRNFSAPNIPGASKFGRAFGNFWVQLQTGQKPGDCQSGYRAYPTDLLLDLSFWTRGYAFEVEVIVRGAWAGLNLCSVDIPVYYPPKGKRISHFNKLKDNLRLSLLNTHLTMRSIVPWPHPKLSARHDPRDRVTLRHPLHSLRNLLTKSATPRQLAMAVAGGVFLGALPLIAIHTITIIFVMGFLGLNKPAALAGSQLCMPPIVPALCIEAGYYMRHGALLSEISLRTLGYQALDRLWEWCLGSIVVAPALALLFGGITYILARQIESRRTRPIA